MTSHLITFRYFLSRRNFTYRRFKKGKERVRKRKRKVKIIKKNKKKEKKVK